METIFRTNIQAAYGRGRWEQFTDPDIADEIWGWEYQAIKDDRTREEHEALDGHLFEGRDGSEVWPPWDFNCRCEARIITNAEAEEEGLKPSGAVPADVREAVEETSFDSPALGFEPPEIELTKYAPELRRDFAKEGR
jgi:SPP1 gp7 family putative phage head morphogenesis protein